MVTAKSVAPLAGNDKRHAMRESNFRLLFAGNTVSLLGDQFYFVAFPWLVLQQTGSSIAMGATMAAGAVPRSLLMLLGGAVSDRVSPRKIMLTAAALRCGLVAVLGLLIWVNSLQTWQLYALAALFGAADAFDVPAAGALMPALVEPEQMVGASSAMQISTQFATIAGPFPAGFVVKMFGVAYAFWIDAMSFLFVIAALIRLPDPVFAPVEKKLIWHAMLDGLRYVGKDKPLRLLMGMAIVMNLCLAGPMSLGLVFLAQMKFGSPAFLGIALSALAAGALCGAVLAGWWRIRRRGRLILLVALLLAALLGSLSIVNGRWTMVALLFLMGVTAGTANVQIDAWVMRRIDPAVRGRVSSLITLGEVGAVPISLAFAGLLIAVSVKLMFVVAGSVMFAVSLVAAAQKNVREIQ